jgi:hypothetical protein
MRMQIMRCFSLLLLGGCYGTAGVSGFQSGDWTACVNTVHREVYLVILTDGRAGAHGVQPRPFLPPRFFGTLEPQTTHLSYSAAGRYLSIGADQYDLTQGRLLAVSFATGAPVIHQIDLPATETVRAFVESSEELKKLFQDNSRK